MSIASEISRIRQNFEDSLSAVEDKGVTVPEGSNSDDLPGLIALIQGGGVIINDAPDENGGTIRTITAANVIKTQARMGIVPTESSQTILPETGYDAMTSVQINAIPSDYMGSDITRRSGTDLTVSGATVSVPAGYYAEAASKSVASGSTATPATTITANPTISVSSSGLITASVSGSKSVTPTVTAGYVSSGTAGTVSVSGSKTQQLTTKVAATITPGTTAQTIAAGTYLTGTQTIAGDSNLIAGNIRSGVSIFNVTGTYDGPTIPSASGVSF